MKPLIESYTKPWRLVSSEYTFTNLYMWGCEAHISILERDDTLFILLDEAVGGGVSFMFAPLTRDPGAPYCRAMDTAAELCRELGIQPVFRAVSGPINERLRDCGEFTLIEERDNFDYIYSMEELLNLAGKKLHAKRNHINQFRAQYDFEYVKLDPSKLNECMAIYDAWQATRDVFDPLERPAIELALTHMEALGVLGGGIRVEDKLVAFTLGELIDSEHAVVHIEKAEELPGLYTVINQQFVEHELTGVKYINREEDMGIPGLRRAKLSYNPVHLIEKYEARPK